MADLEKPTVIERFVHLIPLKYPLAALAWTFIIGPIGFRTVNFAQSGATPFQSPNPVNEFLGTLLGFYLFLAVAYLRSTVVRSKALITPIMTGGEEAYHSVFGRLTDNRSIILLAVPLELLAFLVTSAYHSVSVLGFYNVVTQVVLILSFSSLIWEYSVASWGLHRLGKSPLKLRSFLEDRFMGAKSIGNVALSLTIAYLGGLLLFFLDSATFLPVLDPRFAEFYLGFLVLGVVMFFLPLNSVHRRMQAEKANRLRELNQQLLTLKQSDKTGAVDGPASLEKVESAIRELVQLKDLEMTERKLAATPTWPFDIQVLARLIIIALSVTAALLARFIADFLKI
jgi:hypothetical protein